jgi:hypothetical protein
MNTSTVKNIFSSRKFFLHSLFIFLFLLQNSLDAKTVKGKVIDKMKKQPVAESIILLLDGDKILGMAIADEFGAFTFTNVSLDKFSLKVTRTGYDDTVEGPFNISNVETFEVEIKLEPWPYMLEEIVVMDKRIKEKLTEVGFFARKDSLSGRYITREEIKNRSFNSVSELLSTLPNIKVERDGKILRILNARYSRTSLSMTMSGGTKGAPSVRVYIDGMLINNNDEGDKDLSVVDSLNPNDIAGIEVYSSIEAPMKYGGGWRTGGVILIWTGK